MRPMEKALLVHLTTSEQDRRFEAEESMQELCGLVEAAGAEVVHEVFQRRDRISPKYYIGEGKVAELKSLLRELGGDMVVFDHVLTPIQQRSLEDRIAQNPEWARLVGRKQMAIGVVDLSGETPRFARVNGNQMMYAASLPKIAILLAAYVSFEDGSLEETVEVHADLADMIRVSSNSAATRLIDRIGMKKIQTVLRDPQFGF